MSNLLCVICSEVFSSNSEIYSTQCGHIYHYHCLEQWFQSSSTCPQCRQNTSLNTIIRIHVTMDNNSSITENSESLIVSDLLDKIDALQIENEGLKLELMRKDNVIAENDSTMLTLKKSLE